MYRLLGELFNRASAAETEALAYMCEGRLLPAFAGVETGMGERSVAASIAAAARRKAEVIDKASDQLGDLGLVAEKFMRPLKRPSLTVTGVYNQLLEVARTSGPGSAVEKQRRLAALLARASPLEARYIVRLTLGRLRLGVAAPTIIEAVARAATDDPKAARHIIERAYNICSDLGLVLRTLAEKGLPALESIKVRPGSPVRPMLAERLRSAAEIIHKIGRCGVEAKLDGFRCQVHLKGEMVEIYSRNLERMTPMFPDIAAAAREDFDARSAIIDGEALAVNEETGEYYPFQVTVQRKRKHEIERLAAEFPLRLVVFDLLYADGKDLTRHSYVARRAELKRRIKRNSRRLQLAEGETVATAEEVQIFFDREVSLGHEGIIAKRLDSAYEPGARNYNWIKLKRAYRGELNDTVDVVIIGYLRGRGARARLGIGSLVGAVYDGKTDSFKSICKIGSGLSDENWVRIRKLLDAEQSADKPARVDSRLVPDVWVNPRYVVSVLADEITRSPVHTAAQDTTGRGLALRFPRVVGFIREDKSPEDATTTAEITKMYRQQRKREVSS